jgi:hypothetical protein
MLTHEFNPFWKFKIPSKKKSWRSAKTKESLELNWVEFCGWTCIFLGSKNFVRTPFAYVYFFSLDDSIFFERISFPCVLCFVCVTELPRFRQQQWRRRWLLSPGATNPFFFFFPLLSGLFVYLSAYLLRWYTRVGYIYRLVPMVVCQ